jgi:hypothetical protein
MSVSRGQSHNVAQILWAECNSVGCSADLYVMILSPEKSTRRHRPQEHQLFDRGTEQGITEVSFGFYAISTRFGPQQKTSIF